MIYWTDSNYKQVTNILNDNGLPFHKLFSSPQCVMLDENDSAVMIIQQRELINKYKKIADEYEEKSRILLRENIDLKALIKENGINIEEV